jgi:Na+/melibiose symporter-like transporter
MSARQMIGLAAAACVACCIGPIVGMLGAIAAAGLVSTVWIGLVGIAITAAALTAFLVIRRRRRSCAPAEVAAPVALTVRQRP